MLLEPHSYCSEFFIGFEMANISKRIHQFSRNESKFRFESQRHEIQQLTKTITQPLLQRRGLEALRQIVIDTEHYVKQGVLQNSREVEVALKSSGRVSPNALHSSVNIFADYFLVEL